MIPYGRQSIDEADVKAVTDALQSDWLTQGPKVEEFESKLAAYCGAKYAAVVSNGTTALHGAYVAAGILPGDEVITSPITFPATSNAALWQGAKAVFCDVEPDTGNIDVSKIESLITPKTKIIAPIDYTGRPVDLRTIHAIAKKHNLLVIEDACQALGASYNGKKIGSLSDMSVFSFHPVKSITTGEGGAVLTDNEQFYKTIKKFSTHGIERANFVNQAEGPWYFEMQMLGNNYRLTDMQSALGISQLTKLDSFIAKRYELVKRYQTLLSHLTDKIILPLDNTPQTYSAWHLYVVRLQGNLVSKRREIVEALRTVGIGVQIHHYPVYWHPYYQELGYTKGLCPVAESWYESIISLPLYPDLSNENQDKVAASLESILNKY